MISIDVFMSLGDRSRHELIKNEFPITAFAISMRSLVCGVGSNDAPYVTMPTIDSVKVKDPCYVSWKNMMQRCYDHNILSVRKTYRGCAVANEWLSFSSFMLWWENNQVDGWQIDKDILTQGNKIYSELNCVFVPAVINSFITDSKAKRGNHPIGVHWRERSGKFRAQCCNPLSGRQETLGLFDDQDSANMAWAERKLELVPLICEKFSQMDDRVAPALINRFKGML
jgi:hypothetical protein